MADRYPGYEVMAKRDSVSWNDKTREIIDQRLAQAADHRGTLSETRWHTLTALCECILPQAGRDRRPIPLAAVIAEKISEDFSEGYRDARLPTFREAWERGLDALHDEACRRNGVAFASLAEAQQRALLSDVSKDLTLSPHWDHLPAKQFFAKRVLHDLVSGYYAFPAAWNEIGFGGPASPRGYVRLGFDRRDPWEAAEAKPGHEKQARMKNARQR
ncbi:gluconate 2-dehydrogenase subunit 3 family protein [Rhizobium leguminosarum]|uniref:gluconate 2-dehydrogenase subunit 3 family protein n=1 Tax=Rhizobium leguminosarum TaxID=384 RepID=UPI001C9697C4|nr:gluconate 2-dehydrogenase subunit 3 family protein [Rhizobium leguminosarum]MBY5371094.1 gluconate 2-dehydrogenase subunit 3 family protein [Rhizobium leguminosarum]MBY5447469.1 gluconate 2-dehydrogenase subunit 3 family protein [Rhizobium leguminosarum]